MKKLLAALAFLAFAGAAEAQSPSSAACGGVYSNCATDIAGTNIATNQVSVGTTATLVLARREFRLTAAIENTTTNAIYCGGPTVTTATGHLLPGAVGATLTVNTQAPVYCVSSAASVVTEMETY